MMCGGMGGPEEAGADMTGAAMIGNGGPRGAAAAAGTAGGAAACAATGKGMGWTG